ncbi:MAG: type II toxin-antitoxin system HicA family toxin [Bacillus sp. (in: Bacteria)]|nr:type II toxin-antitoxin system HicA family toxin [Bacillus sp. (in: firmicutes)]MCM1425901.1 type II toxin-antitoxin system HicA family toxin [Eubacterium sp.]
MPKKPKELEKILFADGWIFKSQEGSHKHYIHPYKSGKVTIPFHCKDIPKGTENAILKQAELK